MADIYAARSGFACTSPDGTQVIVHQGETVEAGHWLLASNPDAFEIIVAKYQAPTPAVKDKPVLVKPLAPKV